MSLSGVLTHDIFLHTPIMLTASPKKLKHFQRQRIEGMHTPKKCFNFFDITLLIKTLQK